MSTCYFIGGRFFYLELAKYPALYEIKLSSLKFFIFKPQRL